MAWMHRIWTGASRPMRLGALALGIEAALAAGLAGAVGAPPMPAIAEKAPLPALHFAAYAPQKVVYHVTHGAGLLGREHKALLDVVQNHVNAVGPGFIDLRIVLQGSGVDMLVAARHDAALAHTVDRLRRQGVRFVLCYNTLYGRRLDFARDLYGVTEADIVSAAVAEVTALQAAGYAYMKY